MLAAALSSTFLMFFLKKQWHVLNRCSVVFVPLKFISGVRERVWSLPRGMFAQRGVLMFGGVFVVRGAGERWIAGVDKMPSLHSSELYPTTHSNNTPLYEGKNKVQQTLFHIFLFLHRKKYIYFCAKQANTQPHNCFKVLVFQRCQSGVS